MYHKPQLDNDGIYQTCSVIHLQKKSVFHNRAAGNIGGKFLVIGGFNLANL